MKKLFYNIENGDLQSFCICRGGEFTRSPPFPALLGEIKDKILDNNTIKILRNFDVGNINKKKQRKKKPIREIDFYIRNYFAEMEILNKHKT